MVAGGLKAPVGRGETVTEGPVWCMNRIARLVGLNWPPVRSEPIDDRSPERLRMLLAEHVTFEVECIDRMFLNLYVPQLQFPRGLVGYVHRRLGLPIASTAPLAEDHRPVPQRRCTGSPSGRAGHRVGGFRQG